MELRNGALVGGSPGVLPAAARPLFEEGLALVLRRWTALSLAVEHGWGGPQSTCKAEELFANLLEWFYTCKEHYADDLEVSLEADMAEAFNVELEDDSAREVAKELVGMHSELLRGDAARLERLRRSAPAASSASWREQVDLDGTVLPAGSGGSSSSSEGGSDGEGQRMDTDAGPPTPQPPKGPVVDTDGFELVQRRRGGRAARA
ncbi:hypothetical protein WJX81_004218 [Elliptochloris bilobata]|uniref:Pre-rRNA-processing protein TSR2 n=1 Tax=Elliptochloris bilobata TaxID=381761 RepID=A0AAW1RXF7_9CHLO